MRKMIELPHKMTDRSLPIILMLNVVGFSQKSVK